MGLNMSITKKISAAAMLLCASAAASANDVDSFLSRKTDAGFQTIIASAYKSDQGRQQFYNDIASYAERHDNPQDVSRANELLINVTSMLFPQFAGYWDNVAMWQNIPIYQNHDLYDMDRISLPKRMEFPKTKISFIDDGNSYAMVNGNMNGLSHSPYGRSETLMKNGHPGIGTDGEPVQICRLIQSKNAPYVELSYSDARSLYPIIGKGNQATDCLTQSLTHDYWQARRADFFNNFGDIINPPRTLEQF